jgi:hypothetical protein
MENNPIANRIDGVLRLEVGGRTDFEGVHPGEARVGRLPKSPAIIPPAGRLETPVDSRTKLALSVIDGIVAGDRPGASNRRLEDGVVTGMLCRCV